jgi:alkylation response protein AidB-like acyl-CoA dehydrogenase
MDFRVSEDQQELVAGIAAVLAGRLPLEHIRQSEGLESAISADDWATLGETGVFALCAPEPDGLGLGLADAAVVFEELGRALVPGPLVGTFLAASVGLVPGAASGLAQVGVLSTIGAPVLVEHLADLSALLVLPGLHGGPASQMVAPPPAAVPEGRQANPLDPLTPMWHVADLSGGEPIAQADATRLTLFGTVLTAALQVGHATEALQLAVAYAKERHQFGKPIGSFQAIKHICADMLVRSEVARSAVHAAACLVDAPDAAAFEAETAGCGTDELVARSAMGAKLLADEAALANARAAIQVHGGMGFTWEVPLHLHLKRSLVLATTFGSPSQLSAALGALT